MIEVPGSFTLGEQNFSVLIGNLAVSRKGTWVYRVILFGPTLQYSQTLVDLIGVDLDLLPE